jgi:hypothetical protein
MTTRNDDLQLLARILAKSNAPELTPNEEQMFAEMQALLLSGERHVLSRRQRALASDVWARLKPISLDEVPKGREVDLPEVLRNLPKRPPHRRHEVQ